MKSVIEGQLTIGSSKCRWALSFTMLLLFISFINARAQQRNATAAYLDSLGYVNVAEEDSSIFDAARPMHIQQQMWNVVKGTKQQNYVSNPARGGGMHNYGLAVDISIVNAQGDTIPMGTKVDHLGREAHTDYTAISPEALQNRRLLISVMREAGFRSLPTEWWHFNLVSRNVAREKYKVIP